MKFKEGDKVKLRGTKSHGAFTWEQMRDVHIGRSLQVPSKGSIGEVHTVHKNFYQVTVFGDTWEFLEQDLDYPTPNRLQQISDKLDTR